MNKHHESTGPAGEQQITLRGPAELADALPYLMGFYPNDSVVMVALHGGQGRFGGRLRLGIPQAPGEWGPVADQLAECLVSGSERREGRPDAIVIFLCQDSPDGSGGPLTMERLRPFAQRLRTACGALDVPVLEALCISDGRYWSYCCPDPRCCPEQGNPLAMPGTTVMAAAATYAGVHVRGTLRDMEARLQPWRTPVDVTTQQEALDRAVPVLMPRLLDERARREVAARTLRLARTLMDRVERAQPAPPALADAGDDQLIGSDEAAAVILGLQDRETRDRAAAWMEGAEAQSALRLWRALARRCVGRYGEHAAAPLTLAGWVSWSTGDEPGARVALTLALRADPDYTFAQLLHRACNEGLDPEALRRCLRETADEGPDGGPGEGEAVGAETGSGAGAAEESASTAADRGTTPLRVRRVRRLPDGGRRRGRAPRLPGAERGKAAPGSVRPRPSAAGRRPSEARRYGRRGTRTRR
ncbi:DUF4192 domain-containing protein [Streptomyces sp. 43Y-GA-1]|uniref:DUF4192 domain-containing protein n=1 Tax=Streptomyces sp. 43Y-GA-1 TaxID=2939435 RepID=UPI0020C15908|nr:DUF4192 domain-containing protein [Streptomyces sp. 43Y-GA-1]MCL6288046.1 DUF4192 domain-containing protein [Streptomyces sp. 43Y-GA-1]